MGFLDVLGTIVDAAADVINNTYTNEEIDTLVKAEAILRRKLHTTEADAIHQLLNKRITATSANTTKTTTTRNLGGYEFRQEVFDNLITKGYTIGTRGSNAYLTKKINGYDTYVYFHGDNVIAMDTNKFDVGIGNPIKGLVPLYIKLNDDHRITEAVKYEYMTRTKKEVTMTVENDIYAAVKAVIGY